MAIEIVDFPMKNGGFSIAMLVHQRVILRNKKPRCFVGAIFFQPYLTYLGKYRHLGMGTEGIPGAQARGSVSNAGSVRNGWNPFHRGLQSVFGHGFREEGAEFLGYSIMLHLKNM